MYVIRVRDLETGEDFPDALQDSYYTLAWANDNRTLFFVTLDVPSGPIAYGVMSWDKPGVNWSSRRRMNDSK